MYDVILAPTDGSDETKAALDEAAALAAFTGGTIHGLYITDTTKYNNLTDSTLGSLEDRLADHADEAVSMVKSCARTAGVPVETPTACGTPSQEILTYANEHDVDLIVMGTHGRTGFNHFLHGSVTEEVIRNATIPVLVLRVGDQ